MGLEKIDKEYSQFFLDKKERVLYLCTPKYKEGQQRLAAISKERQFFDVLTSIG